MIHINELIVGATYEGAGRNFDKGVWTGEAFRGMRFKFGQYIVDEELHWEADRRCGTFMPQKILEYPDTLYGALVKLGEACRELRTSIELAAIDDWQRIKKFGAAIRAAFKSVLTKEFPW